MKKGLLHVFSFFLILGLGATTALGQVEIDFPSISGSAGQTVSIPITLSGVESTSGFNSFQFDVFSSSASVKFMGAEEAGTIIPAPWFFASNSTANGNPNNRVLASGSSADLVTASGILVILNFQIDAIEEGVTVELQDFRLKNGGTSLAFTPATPTTGLNASSSPIATDDAYSVDEGAALTVDAATGVMANDTDADNDALTATIGTAPTNGSVTLNTDGSFTYTHDGSETNSDSFTYSVSDGSTTDTGTVTITVNPVNDPPSFTQEISDTTIDEGDLLSDQYTATDPEGDTITFSLVSGPAGAAVNGSTGAFAYLATAGSAGTYTVTVQASDGTDAATSSFELTVRNVEQYATMLNGIHQPTAVASAAMGMVGVTFDGGSREIVLSGSFDGLGSFMASAQLMMGSQAEGGMGIFNLAASLAGSGTSGTFEAASNTFDLDTATLPAGVSAENVEDALRGGMLFVNVRTLDLLEGELRGQLLPASNGTPSTVSVMGPSAVTISGEPTDTAFSLSWTAGSDPDGNETKLILDASSDILFGSYLSVTDVSVTTGSMVTYTVAEAASLFDTISGAAAGSIPVGGNEIVYYRLRHTDGAAIATSNPAGVVLTRGLVTSTDDASLPSEFVLRGNYPNPFNPSTTISFDLPETSEVQVDVLDLLGRTMISVPVQTMSAGSNLSIPVDAGELTSGIYMYRVIARGVSQTWVKSGTMTLIK